MKKPKLLFTNTFKRGERIVDTIIIRPWLASFLLAAICALPLSANSLGALEWHFTEHTEQDYAGTKVYDLASSDVGLSTDKAYKTLTWKSARAAGDWLRPILTENTNNYRVAFSTPRQEFFQLIFAGIGKGPVPL